MSLWTRRGATPRLRTECSEAWENIGWENDDNRKVDDIVVAKYAYTSTVYGAQGGEWDTVALLLDTESNKNDTARFWYTAVTRAKKQLYVLLN